MKKRFLVLVVLLIVGSVTFFLSVKDSKIEVEFKYEPMHSNIEPTFMFTANSKHFAIATGEVYYNDNDIYYDRYLLVKNFKLIKKIKNLKSYSLEIRFYDLLLMNNNAHYQLEEDIADFLSKAEIDYGGIDGGIFLIRFYGVKNKNLKTTLKLA